MGGRTLVWHGCRGKCWATWKPAGLWPGFKNPLKPNKTNGFRGQNIFLKIILKVYPVFRDFWYEFPTQKKNEEPVRLPSPYALQASGDKLGFPLRFLSFAGQAGQVRSGVLRKTVKTSEDKDLWIRPKWPIGKSAPTLWAKRKGWGRVG